MDATQRSPQCWWTQATSFVTSRQNLPLFETVQVKQSETIQKLKTMKFFWFVIVAVCLPACHYAKPLSGATGEGDAETEEAPVLFIKGIGNIPVTVLDGPLATPPVDTPAPTESRLPQTTDSTSEPQVPATEKNTPAPTTEQVKTTSAAAVSRGRQTANSARSAGSRRSKETTTTTTEPTTTTRASKNTFGRNRKQNPVAAASSPSRTFSPTPKNFATTSASSTPAAEEAKAGRSRSSPDGLSDFLKARRRERIESTTEADPIAPILAKTKASSDAESGVRGGRRRTSSRGSDGTTATTTTAATTVEVTTESKTGRNRFSLPKTTKNGRSVASTTSKPVVAEQPAASESKPRLLPKKPLVFKPAAPSPLLRKSAQTTTEQPANTLDDLAGGNPEALDETVVIEHEAPAPTVAPAKPLRGSARGLRSGARA